MFSLIRHCFLFQLFLGMVLGVLLGLCMDDHRLCITSMVWSGRFRVLGWACHFQGLFYYLLLFASSLPLMLVCALTLCRVVEAVRFLSNFTINASMILSGWLFCCVGCFIWVFIRYSKLRLSVNMCAGSWGSSWSRMSSIWYMVDISALSMFCSPISLFDIYIFRIGFHMPYPALASSHMFSASFLGGINELFV
jgi:hypothetical protein